MGMAWIGRNLPGTILHCVVYYVGFIAKIFQKIQGKDTPYYTNSHETRTSKTYFKLVEF
jgi:hypothetical protein